jgi:ankyrin repeat protein
LPSNGFGQIIKKLLEAKADVNSVVKENGKESTALMLACMLGESYIMDILLQYNATKQHVIQSDHPCLSRLCLRQGYNGNHHLQIL